MKQNISITLCISYFEKALTVLFNIKSLIRNQKSEVKTSLCIKPNEWIFPRILINKSYHGRSYK